nr:MAG TPA: hypothetical protein [Bacteriophage sp.]DAX16888.1 MAG TPA: hypothetical protein [Caudoviricetes sp.]
MCKCHYLRVTYTLFVIIRGLLNVINNSKRVKA